MFAREAMGFSYSKEVNVNMIFRAYSELAVIHANDAATREQAKGSEQIIRAVESMNRMTQQVAVTTTEQKKGGDQVVKAVESINRSAQETANATGFVAQAATGLQAQARSLTEAIAFFRDSQTSAAPALASGKPCPC